MSIDSAPRNYRTSSFSEANPKQCVSVAVDGDPVFVRHSSGVGVVLEIPRAQWRQFVAEVAASQPHEGEVRRGEYGGYVVLYLTSARQQMLRYTHGEWRAFVLGVQAGELALIGAPEEALSPGS